MQKKFPRYYPKFHIIDAVDAREESSAEFIQKYDKPCPHDKRRPLTKGEKCCAISHLLALEDFLQSGDERCIIVEDDVFGSDNNFDEAADWLDKLNLHGLAVLGGQQGLRGERFIVGREINGSGFIELNDLSKEFLSRACCYSVDRACAQGLIRSQKNCLTRADDWSRLTDNGNMFFSKIFSHPLDLTNSNLEAGRQGKSFFIKIKNDGILNLIRRNLKKSLISLMR